MCNYHDKFLYVSGGHSKSCATLDTVVKYNIDSDMWEDAVNLNGKREYHSSCSLKEMIYVVGGRDVNYEFTKTIEQLNVQRAQSRW